MKSIMNRKGRKNMRTMRWRVAMLGGVIALIGLIFCIAAAQEPTTSTVTKPVDKTDKYVVWADVGFNKEKLETVADETLPVRFAILVNGNTVFDRGLGGNEFGPVEVDVTKYITNPDEISFAFRIYMKDKVVDNSILCGIYVPEFRHLTEYGTEYLLKHDEIFGSDFIATEKKDLMNKSGLDLMLAAPKNSEYIIEYKNEDGYDILRVGPKWVYEGKESTDAKFLHNMMANRIMFYVPDGTLGKGDFAQYSWTYKKRADPMLAAFKATLVPEPSVEMRRATIPFGEDNKYTISENKEKGIESIKRTIGYFKRYNLNTVGFFCLVHGQALYESSVVKYRKPEDWDVLGEIIKEAHRQGISVKPFMCVMTQSLPIRRVKTLVEHPDWAMVTKDGKRSDLWACHSSPGYREYMRNVVKELVTKYDMDGLIMDYNRTNLCYCDRCREMYKKEYGIDPINLGPEDKQWCDWTRGQLTEMIKVIHDTIKEVKPKLPLSAYSWLNAIEQNYADWPTWIAKGYLDEFTPSGYQYTMVGAANPESFRGNCRAIFNLVRQAEEKRGSKIPICFIIGIDTGYGRLVTAHEVAEYVNVGRQEGANGFDFFKFVEMGPFLPELSQTVFTKKANAKINK